MYLSTENSVNRSLKDSVNNLSQIYFQPSAYHPLTDCRLIFNFTLEFQIKQVIHVEIPLGSPL